MYFFEFGLLEYILFIFEMIANCDSYELDVAFNLLGVQTGFEIDGTNAVVMFVGGKRRTFGGVHYYL